MKRTVRILKNVSIEELVNTYSKLAFGTTVEKYGEQAKTWKDKNSTQWKLLIEFKSISL